MSKDSTKRPPPFLANTCPGKTKKGKDGMYIATESKNGVWIWKPMRKVPT